MFGAYASVCDTNYKSENPTEIVTEKTCRLSWKKKKIEEAIEVIFLKKGCQRFEGSESEDCYMVRTCSGKKQANLFSSAPIYTTAQDLDAFCAFSKPQLRIVLGAPDEVPKPSSQAIIECRGNKAHAITLKSPEGKTQDCLFQ